MEYKTIRVNWVRKICYIQLYRPEDNNTISSEMIEEILQVLQQCEKEANIIVIEGTPEIFCFGADFKEVLSGGRDDRSAEKLYMLWKKIAAGPYISIAHVKGKVNAGGIGFVAACDIAIADHTATFSLSELLFGLYPACVLPFLIRRTGYQKAHYFTIMTQPIDVKKAYEWGIVDAYDERDDDLLRRHLLRLERLPKSGICDYKTYICQVNNNFIEAEENATKANQAMFTKQQNIQWIKQFVELGKFPWQ